MAGIAADPVSIVFSYSRTDAQWVRRLQILLQPAAVANDLQMFVDVDDIRVGEPWSPVVDAAIDRADIAIILISASYLASDYTTGELERLRGDRSRGSVVLAPVLVSDSLWSHVPELAGLQFLLDPSRPLDALLPGERDRALLEIASRVIELAGEIRTRRSTGSGMLSGSADQPELSGHERRVFISHSHADGDFAELLKLRLQSNDLSAWIDIDRLEPGVDWQQGIDVAIRSAPAVIAVLSPDARKSEYVTYEWSYALGLGRHVIPIMLRQTQMHPRLATIQYLDFTLRGSRPWDRLVSALKKARSNGARTGT